MNNILQVIKTIIIPKFKNQKGWDYSERHEYDGK